jgi:ribose transport system permease protein
VKQLDATAALLPTKDGPVLSGEEQGGAAWRRSTAVWIGLILLVILLIFGFVSPSGSFFNVDNFADMGLELAEGMCLAVGMTFLLAAGHLDLSVGANVILSGYLGAYTMERITGSAPESAGLLAHSGQAIAAGVAVSIVAGTAFGFINGFLVTRLKISSFIVTLGTTGIGTGAAFVLSNGADIPTIPGRLQSAFGVARIGNVVPTPLVVGVALAAILWYVMNKTRFGLRARAIGSSREAAERAGVSVDREIVQLFTLIGFLAGVASVIDVAEFATTSLAGHATDNLAAIAACVIGGTSLFGGVASVPGSVIGAMFPVVLATGLIINGVGSYWQYIVVGLILLTAVTLDRRRRNRFM